MLKNRKNPASAVTMDARKFLHSLNESAQAKVHFFERLIRRLGEHQQANWRLIGLHPSELIFEDVEAHVYYRADVKRDAGKLTVENVQRIEIVEEKKEEVFDQFCGELVEALAGTITPRKPTETDQKRIDESMRKAELAFGKIESCRFRPSVIPPSGWVRARDGRTHFVPVLSCAIDRLNKQKIVEAAVKVLRNDVRLAENRLVSATYMDGKERRQITLPIDELTRRRVVARSMKTTAESAWRSPDFVEHVKNLAGLICEGKVEEAVRYAAEFLREFQEFALLKRGETEQLIGNALAADGCFNQKLTEDVGLLFHRTDLKVNRKDIVEGWRKTAQKSEFAPLLEEVRKLEEAEDFEKVYESFLHGVFTEAADVREVRRLSYLSALKLVRHYIPEEDVSVKEQLQGLLDRLENKDVDDAALREAEDLLASVSEELLQAVTSLSEFDKMPGEEELPEPGEELPELPEPEAGLEAGAGEEEEEGGAPPPLPPPPAESVQKKVVPISEMDGAKLEEELAAWQVNHQTYLKEDGPKDCLRQLGAYIDRATIVADAAILEGFRALRDQFASGLVSEEKGYFAMPALKSMGGKVDVNYKQCSTQPPVASGAKLKDEGEKMDVLGGKSVDAGKTITAPEKPAHQPEHPLNKGGKGPAVTEASIADRIAEALDGEPAALAPEAPVTPQTATKIEGRYCEACKSPLKEDEIVCPKCAKPAPVVHGKCNCAECMAEMECEAQACPKCGAKAMKEDQFKDPKIPGRGLQRSAISKESREPDELDKVIESIAAEMEAETIDEKKAKDDEKAKKEDEEKEKDKKDKKELEEAAKKAGEKAADKKGDAKEPAKDEKSPLKFTKEDTTTPDQGPL